MTTTTQAFIESASIHSALAALSTQDTSEWTEWDRQSVHEMTYFLMHGNVCIMPGPGRYRGAAGLYARVISHFPELETLPLDRVAAERGTKIWLTRHPDALRKAWLTLCEDERFSEWFPVQRRLFWEPHVRMHEALFVDVHIPYIAPLLGCSEKDLRQIHSASHDLGIVKRWLSESNLEPSESLQLATKGWLLSALIRGKYHERLAVKANLQLIAHPFRDVVATRLGKGISKKVPSSEEFFVRTIIGSAIAEANLNRRVEVWASNIKKARDGIAARAIALPDAMTQEDAERLAVVAAKRIGLSTTAAKIERFFDVGVSAGLGSLIALTLVPWLGHLAPLAGLLGPVVNQAYRHNRGRSSGEDLSRFCLSTERRFRKLLRGVPGRIARAFVK